MLPSVRRGLLPEHSYSAHSFSRLFSGRYLDFVGRRKNAAVFRLSVSIEHRELSFYHEHDVSARFALRAGRCLRHDVDRNRYGNNFYHTEKQTRRGYRLFHPEYHARIGYRTVSRHHPAKINPVYPLYFCDIIAVTIVIVSLATKVHAIVPGFRQRVEVKSLRLRTFIETTALPISFIGFLGAIGFASIMSFIGTYSEVIDLAFAGSIFFIVYSLACLVFRPLFGILLDRYGNHVVMFPVLFAMITGFMAIALADSSFTLLLGAVLVGTGYGSIPSAGQAIAVQKVKPNRFSLATSTLYMSLDAGSGVGPYLLGMIVPVYGFRSVYVCASLLAVVALIFYCGNIFFSRKKNA